MIKQKIKEAGYGMATAFIIGGIVVCIVVAGVIIAVTLVVRGG